MPKKKLLKLLMAECYFEIYMHKLFLIVSQIILYFFFAAKVTTNK